MRQSGIGRHKVSAEHAAHQALTDAGDASDRPGEQGGHGAIRRAVDLGRRLRTENHLGILLPDGIHRAIAVHAHGFQDRDRGFQVAILDGGRQVLYGPAQE